jgi:hypothetical protein
MRFDNDYLEPFLTHSFNDDLITIVKFDQQPLSNRFFIVVNT